jgi:hypothetical protein
MGIWVDLVTGARPPKYSPLMDRIELLGFLRRHRLAVQASVSRTGAPQAAVVGFGVSDELELVFDTLDTTRKVGSLRHHPRTALVVGGDNEQTAQIEGVADEPKGVELARLKQAGAAHLRAGDAAAGLSSTAGSSS